MAIHMQTWARAILMVSPRPFAVLLEQDWAVLGSRYSLTAIGRPAVAKTAMIELSACV